MKARGENRISEVKQRIMLTPNEVQEKLGFRLEDIRTLMQNRIIPTFFYNKRNMRTSIFDIEEFSQKLTSEKFPSNFTESQREVLRNIDFLNINGSRETEAGR